MLVQLTKGVEMEKKKIGLKAIETLKKLYPEAICSLEYKTPFQLLCATMLSAQCTDARVNKITPNLFAKYPDVETMSKAKKEDVEKIIYSCGFYKNKANNLVEMSKKLIKDFNGEIPSTIDELTTLPGVGRKTANLIVGDVFGKSAIVADTHLIRIANRLGLVNSKNPVIVERELKELLPEKEQNDFCHRCVLHGRAVCKSQKPRCEECLLAEFCPKNY
ncbi:MAG: endonuclease III [Clostridia bacterium]|nr:endonuclease III [Clostridia bacterium]